MIFRLTKIASEQTKISLSSDVVAPNKYCDWFVDLVIGKDRKKYLFITNAFSLFSVCIPVKGIKSGESFAKIVINQIKLYFEKTGHSDLYSQFIEPFENEMIFTKTNSRNVLSSMTNMKYILINIISHVKNDDEQEKIFEINDRINKVPCNCANTGVGGFSFANELISSDLMKLPITLERVISKPKTTRTAYQFYAVLADYDKKVWRRFIISADSTFERLAYVLMAMFNMEGSHLYRFDISQKQKERKKLEEQKMSEQEIEEVLSNVQDIIIEHYVDEEKLLDDVFFYQKFKQCLPIRFTAYDTRIKKLLNEKLSEVSFVYDFGDDWKIDLILEETAFETDLPTTKLPNVLQGEGMGIIENCGGVSMLETIREAFETKSGDEYEEFSKWLGVEELDLDSFDVKSCNSSLRNKMRAFNENYWE